MKRAKAVPVVTRYKGARLEILVFAHPLAGTQIVKGSVEAGESVAQAAVRELEEESGIAGAECVSNLGSWEVPPGQVWHFRQVEVRQDLPESWGHFTEDGGGHLFRFSWHPLAEPAPSSCHPVFVAALQYLRSRLLLPNQATVVPSSGAA